MISKIKGAFNNQGFIRYFKNTAWMMSEQILRIISGLFVGIWVARYLGPEQFGLFSYAFAFTAIFSGIAKLGVDSIIVREIINHPMKRDAYLGTAFWLKLCGALLVVLLMVAIVPFTSNDATTNFYILIISSGLAFQSFEVVAFYFESQVRVKTISICKIIQLFLSSIIKVYLVLTEAELVWFVWLALFDAVTLAVLYFFSYQNEKNAFFYKQFDYSLARRLLKDSWPLIFSSIMIMVYMRIDQVMIKEMLGEYEVGIYSAAIRLSESFYFIATIITTSLFPAILNAKGKNEELYIKRLQKLYVFMMWSAIVIVFFMLLLGGWLITFLFGGEYQESRQVLSIHIWSLVFVFLGVASSKWYVANNLQRLALVNTFAGAVSNIILNVIFIPVFGLVGVAYATVISYCVSALLMNFVWRESRGNFYMLLKSLLLFRKV